MAMRRGMAKKESTPRFAIGDRVRCKTSSTKWDAGGITQLSYRENDWPQDTVVPYQIQLDNGRLIYCPDDSESLIQAAGEEDDSKDESAEILVCQAGTCRRMGSEAVLFEIEELASSVGAAVVRPSGCLGNCSQAPNAIVVSDGDEKLFAQLRDLSCSTKVVEHACGRTPNLGDDELVAGSNR